MSSTTKSIKQTSLFLFIILKKHEYNKPSSNTLVINKTCEENDMDKKKCNYLETEQQGMTITFVFPTKNQKEGCTKNEIKNILTSVLQQYLTKEV